MSINTKILVRTKLTRFVQKNYEYTHCNTVNPRITPRGLIYQQYILGGGLFERGTYLNGGLINLEELRILNTLKELVNINVSFIY